MKQIINVLIVIALIYGNKSIAAEYSININEIKINSKPLKSFSNIIIADTDSIKFEYILNQNNQTSTGPFLYKLILNHNGEISERTAGLKEVLYFNLKEGQYIFDVSAFDLAGKWKSTNTKIKFEVNNKIAELTKKMDTLESSKAVADSTIASLQKSLELDKKDKKIFQIIIYVLAGLGTIFLFLFVFSLIKSRQSVKNIDVLKDREEELLREIVSLKKELKDASSKEDIEKLKNKIDNINKKLENISALNELFNKDVNSMHNKVDDLSDLQKRKNSFFGEIIKGISNPTDTIKGLVDLLKSYDFNAMELNDIINNIIDYTNKIIDNAEDIQRLVEFEDNKVVEVDLDTFDSVFIIEAAINKNIVDAKRKNITINAHIEEGIEKIQGDQHKLIVVMHNLINNAIKFTNDNGEININVYKKEDCIHFEVSDNGIGIQHADLQKIYKNLSKDYNEDVPIGPDSTIGLLTIKKYIDAHGGRIKVSSVVNKGSTFSFDIPISSKVAG